MPTRGCQIQCLPQMIQDLNAGKVCWQRRNRLKRFVKRRMRYLVNHFANTAATACENQKSLDSGAVAADDLVLENGDMVRVRSREEIQATLDNWNQLKRCSFMEEMDQYCGTYQRVFKRVEKFLDERDYLTKKCNGIVILDNVHCEGTVDFGGCDRSCYFFWRKEWLEKVDTPELSILN